MDQLDKIEQLAQLGDEKEDLMLKDFLNKREALVKTTVNALSGHCLKKCQMYAPAIPQFDPKNPDQKDERVVPRFTKQEELCVSKCESKVLKMNSLLERHFEETFNPTFVHKFI